MSIHEHQAKEIFKEFIGENKYTISNQPNEFLLEFDNNQCKF